LTDRLQLILYTPLVVDNWDEFWSVGGVDDRLAQGERVASAQASHGHRRARGSGAV